MTKFHHIGFYLLLLYTSASWAVDTALTMQAVPAWNGMYKSGKATEVKVQLLSSEAEQLKVQLGQLTRQISLKAGIPATLSLVYKPERNAPAIISTESAIRPDTAADKQLSFSRVNAMHIAVSSDGLSLYQQQTLSEKLQQIKNIKLNRVSSAPLPDFVLGYQAVDLVILHFSSLKNMQEQQTIALTQYIEQCGKIIAVQWPNAIYTQLNQLAGCHGQFFTAAASIPEVSNKLFSLLKYQPNQLPSLRDLKQLKESVANDSSVFALVLIFCCSYLVLVFIASIVNRHLLSFIMLPLLASIAVVAIWFAQSPQLSLTSWLDVANRQSTARYIAQLNIVGRGAWQQDLELPIAAGFAESKPEMSFKASAVDTQNISTLLAGKLFSRFEWFWQSTMPVSVPLVLDMNKVLPGIKNISTHITQAGFLSWQGQLHSFPALKPEQYWQASSSTVVKQNTPLLKLLEEQARPYAAALLIPYTANIITSSTVHQGWLFVHSQMPGELE